MVLFVVKGELTVIVVGRTVGRTVGEVVVVLAGEPETVSKKPGAVLAIYRYSLVAGTEGGVR